MGKFSMSDEVLPGLDDGVDALFIVELPTPQRTPVFNGMSERGLRIFVLYLRRESLAHGWGETGVRHPHAYVCDETPPRVLRLLLRIVLGESRLKVVAPFGHRGWVRLTSVALARLSCRQLVTRSDANIKGVAGENVIVRQLRRIIVRAIFPKSTRIWTVGSDNTAYWRNYLGFKNTVLIPYSTPYLPSGATPKPRHSDPSSMTVLYVGRLSAEKAVSNLIKAFGSLTGAEYRRWRLIIVGDGPLRGDLERQANSDRRVRFVGKMKYDELNSFYSAADIFVLPSYYEPWGLVVNEAMAFGCRVLVSKEAGSAELIDRPETGDTFDPHAVGELAEKLRDTRTYLDRTPIGPFDPAPAMASELVRMGCRFG